MKRSLGVAALVFLAGLSGAATAQNIQRLPHAPISLLPPVARPAPSAAYYTARRTTYDTYFADGPPPAPVADSTGPSLATEGSAKTAPAATSTLPAPRPESRTSSFSAWAGNEQALEDTGWSNGCDSCDPCCGAPCDYGWFASAGAVVLTRTRGPANVMSYVSGTGTPVLTTQSANAGWTGGGEVTLGYAFEGLANNVGPWGACSASSGAAIAFTWWGTGEMNGFGQVSDPSGATTYDASFSLIGLTIDGNPSEFYFDDASAQRISRCDIVNSAEINLLTGTLISSERFQVTALAGFRYFRAFENIAFSSLTNGGDWDDPDDFAVERFRCLNNLYGAQLGSVVNFNFTPEWSLFFVPKAGVYGNQMTVQSRIYAGNGSTAFELTEDKTDVAFLGQIDTGLNWHFRSNVYGYLGYRIVGVSNVALGENQFAPSIGDLKQGSSLILHGAFLGIGWLF